MQLANLRHTPKHFRDEFWFPKLFDRNNWDVWESSGAKSMIDRAVEEKKVIKEHKPNMLDSKKVMEIDQIVEVARRDILGL